MVTAKRTTEIVDKVEEQPIVEEAWAADRGYVIAVLTRVDLGGSIFQLIDLADHLDMNGEIQINGDWKVDGETRDAVHLEHVDRHAP